MALGRQLPGAVLVFAGCGRRAGWLAERDQNHQAAGEFGDCAMDYYPLQWPSFARGIICGGGLRGFVVRWRSPGLIPGIPDNSSHFAAGRQ